jgi:glutaredoxin-related protein
MYRKESPKHSVWPSAPNGYYGDEWISWNDLFGGKKPKYITLRQLKKAVKKEGIYLYIRYHEKVKKHPDWPCNPNVYYGDEWVSWPHLFGKKEKRAT